MMNSLSFSTPGSEEAGNKPQPFSGFLTALELPQEWGKQLPLSRELSRNNTQAPPLHPALASQGNEGPSDWRY